MASGGPRKGGFVLYDELISSCISSINFTVKIDGEWNLHEDVPLDHHDPDALCRHYIREQVSHILLRYSVLDVNAAQDAVNVFIARPFRPMLGVTANGSVQLAVRRRDRMLALDHLRTEQRGDVERQEIRRRLVFMQGILSDPDLSRVWWVDRYPDRLSDLETLEKHTGDLRPPFDAIRDDLRAEVSRFVDQLLADIHTPQQREIFLRALTQTLQNLGSPELQKTASHWLRALRDPDVSSLQGV